jgi:hypothetical protein
VTTIFKPVRYLMRVYGYDFDQANYFLNLRLKSLLPLNFGKLDCKEGSSLEIYKVAFVV